MTHETQSPSCCTNTKLLLRIDEANVAARNHFCAKPRCQGKSRYGYQPCRMHIEYLRPPWNGHLCAAIIRLVKTQILMPFILWTFVCGENPPRQGHTRRMQRVANSIGKDASSQPRELTKQRTDFEMDTETDDQATTSGIKSESATEVRPMQWPSMSLRQNSTFTSPADHPGSFARSPRMRLP